ncbi:hypothetical protein [Kribbella pratensis]|uniref:Uncharacterized protein n=1 Tax=Kribbella pratensis TaxID=2512112 RepID=A0A4R8BYG6_9ACTN|nr:hypothetical protein [Kribbella pratensis]TDW66193.1 hypothetical protein EV653_6215 [Kribbella pratensis]
MTIHPELAGDIEVRTEPDGAVVIGPDPIGAAGLVFVSLDGSLLAVDPMAPHGPVQLRVSDPARLSAIEAVYGADAAAAVMRSLTSKDGASIRVPLVDSPERDALVRLGIVRWLKDRCPVAVDRPLLIVEEEVLATRLRDLLDADHTPPDALLDWAPTMVQWARASRRTGSTFGLTPAVPALIADALREVEALLASQSESELLDDLQHETELLLAQQALDLPAVDPDAEWAVMSELSPRGADLMGNDDTLTYRRRGPVDWDRTPPTSTSRAEDAVSWSIAPQTGGDLLTVVVKTFPESPHASDLDVPSSLIAPPALLQATLYQSSWPLPLAVVDLESRPENEALMGSLRLDPVVTERIRSSEQPALSVEVQVKGIPSPPRTGAEARRAAAIRWATRGLCGLRLASVAPLSSRTGLLTTALEALAAAARRYAELPNGGGTAAAAQCEALMQEPASSEPIPGPELWIPDDVADELPPLPAGDPWTGPGRATAAEYWYSAAPPLAAPPADS